MRKHPLRKHPNPVLAKVQILKISQEFEISRESFDLVALEREVCEGGDAKDIWIDASVFRC